jgi:hypothetical protein
LIVGLAMTVDDTAGLRVAFSDEIEREVCVLCARGGEREGERETEAGSQVSIFHTNSVLRRHTHTRTTHAQHTHTHTPARRRFDIERR